MPLREAVYRGSMERLNPVLMTALSAGLALVLVPLAGAAASFWILRRARRGGPIRTAGV